MFVPLALLMSIALMMGCESAKTGEQINQELIDASGPALDGGGIVESDGVIGNDDADAGSGSVDGSSPGDQDGDGVPDKDDAFPNDPNEWADTDGDGIGDNTDADIDGDGWANSEDAFPSDASEWADTDGDGTGDNADTDLDGDGVENAQDAFPNDPEEASDTDGDGVGDNADADIDGDGWANSEDAFPSDASEWADTDGDGVGDNADSDKDGDGVPNADDAFPDDPAESSDADGDGVGDNQDPDDNGDGVPDDEEGLVCAPNSSFCDGGWVMECDPQGASASMVEDCVEAGKNCVAGACAGCSWVAEIPAGAYLEANKQTSGETSAFTITRTLISNSEWAECMAQGGCSSIAGLPAYPGVCGNSGDAHELALQDKLTPCQDIMKDVNTVPAGSCSLHSTVNLCNWPGGYTQPTPYGCNGCNNFFGNAPYTCQACQTARGQNWPMQRMQHPVNFVTYEEAIDYCTWRGGRLPTYAELRRAVIGGCELYDGEDCASATLEQSPVWKPKCEEGGDCSAYINYQQMPLESWQVEGAITSRVDSFPNLVNAYGVHTYGEEPQGFHWYDAPQEANGETTFAGYKGNPVGADYRPSSGFYCAFDQLPSGCE